MAIAKIVFPDQTPVWTMKTRLEVGDINYGGHMGNEVVLRKVQEARMQFLQHWGWTELDAAGVGLIQVESWVRYQSEGFWGEELQIEIFAEDIHSKGFTFLYRLQVCGNPGRALAAARTAMLCFNYQTRKSVQVPQALKLRLKGG